MKNLFKSIKTSTIKAGQKVGTALATAAFTAQNIMLNAYADDITVNTEDIDTAALMGKIVGTVLSIFQWIGVLLLVWGVGQLVMAFKNEDADSKSRAIMMIVSSALLIGLKALLTAIGIIS